MDLSLLHREQPLLDTDINTFSKELKQIVSTSSFLVLGGAGSIGQAVAKEIFKRNPKKLHVVDISENNLVELVRDIRSSLGYINGDFKTFALDINSISFDSFYNADGNYDYIMNLSALKHVRSEKDPFTLMRMIEVNILNTLKTIKLAKKSKVKNYFCVSTDKATNPVNMMGASKRIMELFLIREATNQKITTARFANVAFSDGSLLKGFENRINKKQPLAAPKDIKRYFISQEESGQLCLMACLLGKNRDIFFPKLKDDLHLITFTDIAKNFLKKKGFTPFECSKEEEARLKIDELISKKQWPCFFEESITTGEKPFEEFYRTEEEIDLKSFSNIGIVKNKLDINNNELDFFIERVHNLLAKKKWNKVDLINLFKRLIPEFNHHETHKYLDSKM